MNKSNLTSLQAENKSTRYTLPFWAGVGENKRLSKSKSGLASRYPLAFFVSKNWLASQASQATDTTHLAHIVGLNRHIMPTLAAVYDGVTLQNKRKPICRAVSFTTESEPHHPMKLHSVVLTQKVKGGHTHA